MSGNPSAGGSDDPSVGADGRLASSKRLELGAGDLVASVVARADERSGFDVLEPQRQRLDLHLGELVGVVIALDGQMVDGRPQVLPDREDVRVDLAEGLK